MSGMTPQEEVRGILESIELKDGESRMVGHDCLYKGASPKLSLTRKGSMILFHCYRCPDFKGGIYIGETTAQRLARLTEYKEADQRLSKAYVLPPKFEDSTNTMLWRREYIVWLLKAGISPQRALEYGMYLNIESDRLIIPVDTIKEGKLYAEDYWIGRGIERKSPYIPKYKSQYNYPKGTVVFLPHRRAREEVIHHDVLVLTEDYLSSLRICRAGFDSIPLMGVEVTSTIMEYIITKIKRGVAIIIWLDNDEAGITNAESILKEIKMMTDDCYLVRSKGDPKEEALDEVQRRLIRFTTS